MVYSDKLQLLMSNFKRIPTQSFTSLPAFIIRNLVTKHQYYFYDYLPLSDSKPSKYNDDPYALKQNSD